MIIFLSDIRSHVVDKSIRSEKESYISSQRWIFSKTRKLVPPPAPICHPVLVKTPFQPALWTSNWLKNALLSQPRPAPVTAHGTALPNMGLWSHASGAPFEDGKNTLDGWSGIREFKLRKPPASSKFGLFLRDRTGTEIQILSLDTCHVRYQVDMPCQICDEQQH
jgi:hypothetical protein